MNLESESKDMDDLHYTMLLALVKWGCSSWLLDQVSLWIEEAFQQAEAVKVKI